MATTYIDQFFVMDPAVPPAAGTSLTVEKFELVDVDDDGDVEAYGSDTVNGQDVTAVYQNDSVTVQYSDGSIATITGTTFYLADGTAVFTPSDGSTLEDATFVSSTYTTTEGGIVVDALGPPCFTLGTRIRTPVGDVRIQQLQVGDMVCSYSDDHLVLKAVLQTSFNKNAMQRQRNLMPIRIVAGALGNGLPSRDLLVSQQHRILVNGAFVHRIISKKEGLVAAKKLTHLPGIYVDESLEAVTYFHLVFDNHEIIYAEDTASESFLPGPVGLESISEEARHELNLIFPDIEKTAGEMVAHPSMLTNQEQNEISQHFASDKSGQQTIVQSLKSIN